MLLSIKEPDCEDLGLIHMQKMRRHALERTLSVWPDTAQETMVVTCESSQPLQQKCYQLEEKRKVEMKELWGSYRQETDR